MDSIHLIKNAVAVITDSGCVLQEAHFAQTPYVFVLDIPRVLENTRFEMSRLVKPERKDILAKLHTLQQFDTDKKPQVQDVVQNMAAFEENVLKILREFEKTVIR